VPELRELALDVLHPAVRAGDDLDVGIPVGASWTDAFDVQVLDAGERGHGAALADFPDLRGLRGGVGVVERRRDRERLAVDRRDPGDLPHRPGVVDRLASGASRLLITSTPSLI
jgi:hypothetical protein